MKPSQPEATIYLYGIKPGDKLDGVSIYLGMVNDDNELNEVSCVKATGGEEELILSVNLIPKAQYYILTSSGNQTVGDVLRLCVRPEYIEEHDAAKNLEKSSLSWLSENFLFFG